MKTEMIKGQLYTETVCVDCGGKGCPWCKGGTTWRPLTPGYLTERPEEDDDETSGH